MSTHTSDYNMYLYPYYVRGGNPKRIMAKIKKMSKIYYLLDKFVIKNDWSVQNEPFPYIKIIFRKSKRIFSVLRQNVDVDRYYTLCKEK